MIFTNSERGKQPGHEGGRGRFSPTYVYRLNPGSGMKSISMMIVMLQ